MTDLDAFEPAQRATCREQQVEPAPIEPHDRIGIARTFDPVARPLHALRHPQHGNMSGWYLWTGDFSDDPDFFSVTHAAHLVDRCVDVVPYLWLPAGWRLLVGAGDYRDVWFDASLLDI